MTTLELISLYQSKGWEIFKRTIRKQDGTLDVFWSYKSPRMSQFGMIKEQFDEEELIKSECKDYALDQHGAAIAITLGSVHASIIKELATLYFLKEMGKVGVEIPIEIVLKELRVPVRTGEWKPSNEVVDGAIQEGETSWVWNM